MFFFCLFVFVIFFFFFVSLRSLPRCIAWLALFGTESVVITSNNSFLTLKRQDCASAACGWWSARQLQACLLGDLCCFFLWMISTTVASCGRPSYNVYKKIISVNSSQLFLINYDRHWKRLCCALITSGIFLFWDKSRGL